ncbi:MAG: taurine catabolism dioxygenase TauD [Okeania sp. SIO2C9]|uniref:TauD/TfdA family dioxygenase n=1 Tax=Okeania sp. SIO2C9 TaxID=2607791 RepID=UPI0013C01B2B|nr:TauD/TfdA family dioxygenase [Okeania sp. SIO2C9]NEQ75304.1 taurine catabolism dioxygenase TauD [Okeania sp. SIO2C9]
MTINHSHLKPDRDIELSANQSFVTVAGKRFYYIWLRDNCLDSQSRHGGSWEKLNDISKHKTPPQPLSIQIQDNNLIIDWDENPPHRSIFPISWLLNNTYDVHNTEEIEKQVILWNKAWLETNSIQKYDLQSCSRESWMNQLLQLGFVVIRNIPLEELESFLVSLGPIRNTEYGTIITQNTSLAERDIAATSNTLTPHTDLSFWCNHKVTEFLYSVTNDTIGGESLVVDGFSVARDFREDHPNDFRILAETLIPFCRVEPEYQYSFRPKHSIIELDREDEIVAVRFSHKNCTPILPAEQIEAFYQAYITFSHYLKNQDYQYRFRLEPGDCLLMQNFRILHGRTAFESNSGSREFRVGYIEWDYVLGRYFYQREFNQKFSHNN